MVVGLLKVVFSTLFFVAVDAQAYVNPIVPTNANTNGIHGGSGYDCVIPARYFPQPYSPIRNPAGSSSRYAFSGYGSQYGGSTLGESSSSTGYGANYGGTGASPVYSVYSPTASIYGPSAGYGSAYGSSYNAGGHPGAGGQFPPSSYGYVNKYGGYSRSGYEGPYGGVNDYTQVGIAYPPPGGLTDNIMGGSAGSDGFLSSTAAAGNTNGMSATCRDRSPDCAMLAATGQCALSTATRVLCPISCGTGCSGLSGLFGSGLGGGTPTRHPTLLNEALLSDTENYDSTIHNSYGFNPSDISSLNQNRDALSGAFSPLNLNNINNDYGSPYGGSTPPQIANAGGYGSVGYGNPYSGNSLGADIYSRPLFNNPDNLLTNAQLQRGGRINNRELLNYESAFGFSPPLSASGVSPSLPSGLPPFLQYPTEQDVGGVTSLSQDDLIAQSALPLFCQDSHVFGCQNWAMLGYCESAPSYMLVYCRASCGICRDPAFINYYGSYNPLSKPPPPPFLDEPLVDASSRLRNASPPANGPLASPFQRDNNSNNVVDSNALLTQLLRNQQQLSAQETRGLLSALSAGSDGGLRHPGAVRFADGGATLPYSLKSLSVEKHQEAKQKPSSTASILRDTNATPLSTSAAAATAAHDALSSSFHGVLRMDDLVRTARQ